MANRVTDSSQKSGVDVKDSIDRQIKALSGYPCVIPFHYSSTGKILLPIRLGEQKYQFILDTGSDVTVKWKRSGERITTTKEFIVPGRLLNVPFKVTRCTIANFGIGSFTLRNATIDIWSCPKDGSVSFEPFEFGSDGLLGGDLLHHFTVCIDYKAKQVVLRDPDDLVAFSPDAIFVPFKLTANHLINVDMSIDDQQNIAGIIDTGCTDNVILADAVKSILKEQPRFSVDLGLQAEKLMIVLQRFKSLSLGNLKYKDPICTIRTEGLPGSLPDAMLGAPFLSHYKIVIDYRTRQMAFEPYETDSETIPEILQLANSYRIEHKFAEAANAFQKITELDSDLAIAAYKSLGSIQLHLHQYSSAITSFTRLIELSPRDAQNYASRGSAYANAEDIPKALDDYSKAISLGPKCGEFHLHRGYLYQRLRNYKLELVDSEKALSLDPHSAKACVLMGNAHAGMVQYHAALDDCNKALSRDPKDIQAHILRAWISDKLKKPMLP